MPQTFPPHLVAEVASLVELVTGTPRTSIRPESRFVDDLEVDSLSMIEVLEGLERRLGVVVADSATSQLVHVGDLLDYLVTHGTR